MQTTIGLGTALSDYVRQVGAGSNFTVHLVLDETPTRLPIDAETELLRIAQEAITNARKHANAQNLWVTCRIDPPRAYAAPSRTTAAGSASRGTTASGSRSCGSAPSASGRG